MPDLRFLIDFHWATSWLVGGWSSCRDDRSANAGRDDGRCSSRAGLLAVGDNAGIGSSWMQKPSSASSESTAAASSLPSADSGDLRPSNVRSSDKTNRLEFLRCWIMATVTRLYWRRAQTMSAAVCTKTGRGRTHSKPSGRNRYAAAPCARRTG